MLLSRTVKRVFRLVCWVTLTLFVSMGCWPVPMPTQVQPSQTPPAIVPPPFADCRHDYEGIWHCVREDSRYHVLYADLSNPFVRTDVVMAGYSIDPQEYVAETVSQIAQRYADRFPGLQAVAGINANYFGPGHHGPQGLVKATTRQGGSPSGRYTTLFSPYLNSQTHDGVERSSSLGISYDERLMMDRDFYNQYAGWIGGSTGGGRALSAGPRIVWQGVVLPENRFAENCSDEGHPISYCTQAQPRAALGIIDQRGLVLSVGQQDVLRNMALLLQEHAVDYAMKLDDGSSAQLWYLDDPFVPAGGGHPVANALLIYSRPLDDQIDVASSATVLLVDVSGSMGADWRGGVKIESAKDAADNVINMIEQESQIGGSDDQGLTTDYGLARQIVSGLEPLNSTNIGAGLQVANQALASASGDTQKIVILLSDGLTNEGMSPTQILAGPVQEAAAAGTCIYTVGFGDPGDLDETLLRQIAEGSGCGTYTYASAPSELERVYIRLRHESLGTVLREFEGQIAQGEMVDIGQVEVPRNQGELYVTLAWPGSDLDLIVIDPKGRPLDETRTDVSLVKYGRLVYLIVQNPIPGMWLLQAFGANVPQGILDYTAIASVRERVGPPPTNVNMMLLVVGLAVLVAAVLVFSILNQQRRGRLTAAGVQVVSGQPVGGRASLRRGQLTIGRHPHCEMVLPDPQISARHAVIQRMPEGYMLRDLGSKNGTFVNGQQVQQVRLQGGERLRLGKTELVFTAPGVGVPSASPIPPSSGGGTAYLAIVVSDQEFARYPVASGTVLGRYASCPVDLSADALISREHARLDYESGQWIIADLGSDNGTFVNGQRVTSQALQHGSEIRMGNTHMRFYVA
jgi:pSer/pThr/pTyr-binding forkhead associated (FHA) protein